MNKFLSFLVNNPVGTAFKVFLGSALGYVLTNIGSWDLPTYVIALAPVILTPVINALNPQDTRYGVGADAGE